MQLLRPEISCKRYKICMYNLQKPRPVARSGNGGVRKKVNVDLTSGRWPRWVARYEKWRGGGGGGFKPYNQTSAWDGAPTVLQCFSLCLNTILRCNMQIE